MGWLKNWKWKKKNLKQWDWDTKKKRRREKEKKKKKKKRKWEKSWKKTHSRFVIFLLSLFWGREKGRGAESFTHTILSLFFLKKQTNKKITQNIWNFFFGTTQIFLSTHQHFFNFQRALKFWKQLFGTLETWFQIQSQKIQFCFFWQLKNFNFKKIQFNWKHFILAKWQYMLPSSLDCLWCHKLISKFQKNKKWCWIPPLMRRFQKSFKKITKWRQSFHPNEEGLMAVWPVGKVTLATLKLPTTTGSLTLFHLEGFFFWRFIFLKILHIFFFQSGFGKPIKRICIFHPTKVWPLKWRSYAVALHTSFEFPRQIMGAIPFKKGFSNGMFVLSWSAVFKFVGIPAYTFTYQKFRFARSRSLWVGPCLSKQFRGNDKKTPKSFLEMKGKREAISKEVIVLDDEDDAKDVSSSSSFSSSFSSLATTPSQKCKFGFHTIQDLGNTSFEGTPFPQPTLMTPPVPPLDSDFMYFGIHSRFFSLTLKSKKKYLLCELVFMKMFFIFHFKGILKSKILFFGPLKVGQRMPNFLLWDRLTKCSWEADRQWCWSSHLSILNQPKLNSTDLWSFLVFHNPMKPFLLAIPSTKISKKLGKKISWK